MNPLNPEDAYSSYRYNGIDRVDNNKGYEIENVVTCCTDCNKKKLKKTQEEFRKDIIAIYKYWASKQ